MHTENIEFQEYRTEVQVLNAIAIASGYAGHDPQGGTSDGSICKFSLVHKKWLKFFFQFFRKEK